MEGSGWHFLLVNHSSASSDDFPIGNVISVNYSTL
ncbi:hypothetical protein A1122_06000 [Yersinia pestis A1122]|nr:hypothetical protein A1122_06000 [Yersinia pestis A1122]EKS43276.1 hypothetical protein INS_20599 [Yersinia pestis INS]ERP78822.1 hypothetical protein L328_19725 [Yersinia pestis 24H]ERP78982.1 hypothetical protein L327_19810 [Yersinia pestis S3]ERP79898.1 hypothetical protein L326_19635 [Yersinia pestis 113]ERP84444.1 hypothetical protein L325_19710 [Yersinia pestis 9]